jgi:hypothetical protein
MMDWPPYSIGPRESIFALGVISGKFVELESILEFIFGTILRLDPEQTRVIFAKLGCGSCLQMSSDCLAETGWTDDTKDYVTHFLKAVNICADNRNVLMHSHVVWRFGERTVLFKKSRSGGDLSLSTTLAELRRVADEMNVFCTYGRQLGNAINNTLTDPPVFPVTAYPWPTKPPLPSKLNFAPYARP